MASTAAKVAAAAAIAGYHRRRLDGPVVLAGHAYGGAVIAETRDPKVASLVYIAGLAPEEGETVSDVFYRGQPHPKAPELKPDPHRLVWLPTRLSPTPSRRRRRRRSRPVPLQNPARGR